MGEVYSHLSEEERQIIQIEIDNGTSIRRIAGLIGRHASTVSREIVLLQCLLGQKPNVKEHGGQILVVVATPEV